jgi:outer membrane receptor protein involved in Fe transport
MSLSASARANIILRFYGLIMIAFCQFCLSPGLVLGAGDSSLKGRIIGSDSKKPVPNANVHLVGTANSAVTDSEGRFVMETLKPGRYTLLVSHPRYIKQRITLRWPDISDLEIEIHLLPHYHETITVTATPWAVDRSDVAQSASILDTAKVRTRAGLSLGDAIGSLPGVRNVSTGEAGGTPMVRGQTNERVRVLSNGFPHDYYQFSRRHMPNIETYDSSFIEVIRGPASVLYGTQAMGGLINLVSSPLPSANGGTAIFRGEGLLGYAGNNEAKMGHAQIEGASGRFGIHASWTRRGAGDVGTPEGSLPNTGYDQQASLLEIGYQVAGGFRTEAQYRFWSNDLGFYIPAQPSFCLNLRNDIGAVETVVPSEWGEWHFAGNVSRNSRRAFPAGRSQGAKVDLKLFTQSYRASLQHKPSGPFRGWFQFEYTRQRNESFGTVTLLPYYQNRTWSAAVFEEVRIIHSANFDRLVVNLGLRYDNRRLELPANPDRGIPKDFKKNYTPVTGSAGVVYKFTRTLSAGLSFSRGWRNPSEYEMFADGQHDGALLYERGNPDLKEETNQSIEFTLRLEKKRVRGFFAWYRDKYDNYIYQRLNGEYQSGLPVGIFSQSDAVVRGFEGQLTVDTAPWLTLSMAVDALRSKNITTGARLPFSPPDRAIISAHFHNSSSVNWIYPFVEIRSILTGKGEIAGPEEPFPLDTAGYALFDFGAGVQRRFENNILSFDLWISNLANRAYKDFFDTYKLYALSPGRNIRATLRFLF